MYHNSRGDGAAQKHSVRISIVQYGTLRMAGYGTARNITVKTGRVRCETLRRKTVRKVMCDAKRYKAIQCSRYDAVRCDTVCFLELRYTARFDIVR